MKRDIVEITYLQFEDGFSQPVQGRVPQEEQIVLSVNAVELVGLMCTPVQLEELALGFLYNEGIVDGLADVVDVRVCGSGRCVDVWLHKDVHAPALRTITSGCSGGTTFEGLVEVRRPVVSDVHVTPLQVVELMGQMQASAFLYQRSRGIHTTALATPDELICTAEDIGRHNTVDKIAGTCLRQGLVTAGRVLITSGRVSSEMLGKAARMGVPIVISHTSPTSLTVELARAWNITLIGYARGRSFRLYTAPQRVVGAVQEPQVDEGRL